MQTVYICSPYRGKDETEVNEHLSYAVELLEYILGSGEAAPIVPHLYFPQILDDNIESDREIALRCSQQFLKNNCDLMVVGCKYGISAGMDCEIRIAKQNNIPIIWIDAAPKMIIGIFDRLHI